MRVRVSPCLPLKDMCKDMCKDCKRLNEELKEARKVIKDLGYCQSARLDARVWDEYFKRRDKKRLKI